MNMLKLFETGNNIVNGAMLFLIIQVKGNKAPQRKLRRVWFFCQIGNEARKFYDLA